MQFLMDAMYETGNYNAEIPYPVDRARAKGRRRPIGKNKAEKHRTSGKQSEKQSESEGKIKAEETSLFSLFLRTSFSALALFCARHGKQIAALRNKNCVMDPGWKLSRLEFIYFSELRVL
jgi:hypothetical protein